MNGFNDINAATTRQSLFVDVSFSKGTLKASLVGPRIGEREAPVVANAINGRLNALGTKVHTLVMDFSEIQFISSLGLGMCIDVRNTADASNATTAIVGMSEHLTELFEMMRLNRLFQIETQPTHFGNAA